MDLRMPIKNSTRLFTNLWSFLALEAVMFLSVTFCLSAPSMSTRELHKNTRNQRRGQEHTPRQKANGPEFKSIIIHPLVGPFRSFLTPWEVISVWCFLCSLRALGCLVLVRRGFCWRYVQFVGQRGPDHTWGCPLSHVGMTVSFSVSFFFFSLISVYIKKSHRLQLI